jgi:hypothetical protein
MNGTILGTMMIVIGLGLVSGGIMVLSWREAGPSRMPDSTVATSTDPSPGQVEPMSSEEKGRLFEEWVVRKFKPAYFAVKEWRGDKRTAGIYAESSKLPDLEMEFRLRDQRSVFAVECKWRRAFDQGEKPGIQWATDEQIGHYREFRRQRNMPVLVVIGVGGEPDAPAELYIVPLDRLRYPFATAEYLAKFRRTDTTADLYFDPKSAELR